MQLELSGICQDEDIFGRELLFRSWKWPSVTWRATSVQNEILLFCQNCLWSSNTFKDHSRKSPKERLITQYGSTSRSPQTTNLPWMKPPDFAVATLLLTFVTCPSMPFTAVSALIFTLSYLTTWPKGMWPIAIRCIVYLAFGPFPSFNPPYYPIHPSRDTAN